MNLAHSDIEWAKQALADGRPLSFIASVLEMPERKAGALLRGRVARPIPSQPEDPIQQAAAEQVADRIEAGVRKAMGVGVPAFDKPSRKRLLRRRYSSHWDMIWFLRSRHMSGRKLREIYGADALIWSVGGGIDTTI